MVLRPSNIAGRGQSRTEFQPCAFAAMDKCFEDKGYIELTGNGRQRRDFVNVKDVARAFVMALDKMVPGACIDVCTGNRVTLLNVMEFLGVPFKFVDERPGDAKDLVSDPKPAWDLLRFQSQIPFPETVADSFPAVMRAQALRVSQQLQEGSRVGEPGDS
jgi:nucleoside-diphosphate-sugar epimerase